MGSAMASGGQFEVSGRKGKDEQKAKDDNSTATGTRGTGAPAFEVGGRKSKDEQKSKHDNLAASETRETDPLMFEVGGRKSTDGQSTAIQPKQDDGTAAITRGTGAMSIGEAGGSRDNQAQTRAAYTTATLKQSLDVSRAIDKEPCDLDGVVLLQDKIVVSDEANYKLKVFDMRFNFMYDYKCKVSPFDIAMLDNTTIVVTFITRNMRLFSVGDDGMIEMRTIDTEYGNLGVCCYGGDIYCVVKHEIGSEKFSQVRMYTPEGKLKRRYEYLSDGKVECNILAYITVNPQTGTLYVTDLYKGVLALSTSGDVIAVMSPPELRGPQGIAIDEKGHIYVCGCGSDNLIQMSADGQYVVELLSGSIRCKLPQFVKIYGNQMFLGRRNSNIISVYELS